MDLRSKLLDPAQQVLLYGTTPPREGTPPEQIDGAADKLAARLAGLPLDGVVVYDIQDETGRTESPRPFPYIGTVDPRRYAALLKQRLGVPPITYKALGTMDEPQWRAWLADSEKDVQFLSIVGRPASGVKYPMPLSRAIRVAAMNDKFIVGGVVIAERHDEQRSESARLLAKGIEGCGYFISQAVYHAPPTERLLADYLRDCRGATSSPSPRSGARRRSPSCAGSASTSRPRPSARFSARRARSHSRSASAATTCGASSTASTRRRFRSA